MVIESAKDLKVGSQYEVEQGFTAVPQGGTVEILRISPGTKVRYDGKLRDGSMEKLYVLSGQYRDRGILTRPDNLHYTLK